jgi:AraC family transcriptional regulator
VYRPGRHVISVLKLLFIAPCLNIPGGDLVMTLQEQGAAKYGAKDVLSSSATAGWTGLVAEHRHHPKGEVASFQPQQQEIVIATGCHESCIVSRTGDRIRQRTQVEPGMIWFCPVGVQEEDIVLGEWHEALHLYLPRTRFTELSEERGGALYRPEAVPYLGGFYDERIRRIGSRLLGQLQAPGAAGSVLVDLTACVVDGYSPDARRAAASEDLHRLDGKRLRRVLDYMTAHLEDDIGLKDIADEACFSAFHFTRVFANTMGMPPHRYLSRMRLERAKTLLSLGAMPISQIALACCFSSQSNFTRAFVRATGMTPREYRRQSF